MNRLLMHNGGTLLGLSLLFLLGRVAECEHPAKGPPFPRIANVYGTALTADGGSFHGETVALDDIARYDLLIGVRRPRANEGGEQKFREQLDELKRINPDLIALHFACSAPYTHIAPKEDALASRSPGQVLPWLLQTDGRPIAGWPGTYMLNMAVPGVIEWLAQQTVPAVKQIGYDGVFIDCMGPHFDSWACEIATGQPYTVDCNADGQDDDREKLAEIWTAAKTTLAGRVRELLGDDAVFMANQAGPETYGALNGIYLEDYIDAVLDRGMSWETVLEKYLHWAQTPRKPNVTVLGCGSAVEPPFQPFKLPMEERSKFLDAGRLRLQRMRFGLATTLMGDGYYSFDLHTRWRGQYWWYPEFDAPLGYPKASAERQADGTWQRRFDGGVVAVNPTDWDAALEFDDMHLDVSSGQIGRRFVVPRMDGRIFLPSEGPARAGSLAEPEPRLTAGGPAGLIERDGNLVLRDGYGTAILIDESGVIQSVCSDGSELIDGIAPIIVADERWRNFETTGLQHELASDGTLRLMGQRNFEDQVIKFVQSFRVQNDRLQCEYQWRATTPIQLRAFRQAIRLSPRVFGDAVARTDQGEVTLPMEEAGEPNLAKGITSIALPMAADRTLAVQLSHPAHLVDDRHYNGPGYLLAFYPIAGEIAAGREWSYRIEIDLPTR